MLAKGREKSLLRRHPWVFSGAVARMEGKASLGETIDIVDHQGKWLARGAYSPASQIRARVWTFDKDETIDIDFFVRRLQQAQQWRGLHRVGCQHINANGRVRQSVPVRDGAGIN